MRELQLKLPEGPGRRSAIERELREAIRHGRLVAGSVLPSTRVLAADLGVSRSTIVAAYEQLAAEGFVVSEHGRGTRVAEVPAPENAVAEVNLLGPTPAWDFRPGEPDASAFPRQEWLRSLRRVLTDTPDEMLGYPDPRGRIELRMALAEYLGRTRSVRADPAAIQVYGGFASALGFIADALRQSGHDCIAVEQGMLPLHRQVLHIAGLQTETIPVDGEGLDVSALAVSNARAVVVTPANQYPFAVTLSPARRSELVAWANDIDGWIIEDDYDGEFRYDRRPIGALQGLDPGRVIYAGTASKSLGAGLRLGWLVVPEGFTTALLRSAHMRAGVSSINQLALADFIERGQLDRQVRRARRIYDRRRTYLCERLTESASWLNITPSAAGLHLLAELPSGLGERSVLATADEASIGLLGLYANHRVKTGPQGLVIGFSRLSQHSWNAGVHRLCTVLGKI